MELITFVFLFGIFTAIMLFNILNKYKTYGNINGIFAGILLLLLGFSLLLDPVGLEYLSGYNETITGNTTIVTDVYSPIWEPSFLNWNNFLGLFLICFSIFLLFYNSVEAGIEHAKG